MNTTALSTRHPRGINPKGVKLQQLPRKNGFKLPEYLEFAEVNALIAAGPNPKAKLIMLEQWRAGLRVSEALALEARDLHLDSDRPTLVVRQGKGRKPRVRRSVTSTRCHPSGGGEQHEREVGHGVR